MAHVGIVQISASRRALRVSTSRACALWHRQTSNNALDVSATYKRVVGKHGVTTRVRCRITRGVTNKHGG